MRTGRFTHSTAIVTGAAGTIGRAAARRLATEGAAVLVVERDRDGIDQTVAEIESDGGISRGFVADVTDASSVQAYVEAAKSLRDGQVNAFFNNAGIEGATAPIDAYPDDTFDQVLAVNVRGVFLGLEYVADTSPQLRGRTDHDLDHHRRKVGAQAARRLASRGEPVRVQAWGTSSRSPARRRQTRRSPASAGRPRSKRACSPRGWIARCCATTSTCRTSSCWLP